ARRLGVLPGLERIERGFVGAAFVGHLRQRARIAMDRRRHVADGGGRRRGRSRWSRYRIRVQRRGRRALEPVQASVEVEVLAAIARLELLVLLLQFLDLRAQGLYLAAQRGELVEQVDVALVVGGALFERGDTVGEACALRRRGRGGHQGRRERDWNENVAHRPHLLLRVDDLDAAVAGPAILAGLGAGRALLAVADSGQL